MMFSKNVWGTKTYSSIYLSLFFSLYRWNIKGLSEHGYFISDIHELFSAETGTIHKFNNLPLLFSFVAATLRQEMFSFQCFHSFTNKQALCLGCLPCIQYGFALTGSLCYVSLALVDEKLPVCVLFTWQRHRAVWLMHSGLSLPGRLFNVLFIGVGCYTPPWHNIIDCLIEYLTKKNYD